MKQVLWVVLVMTLGISVAAAQGMPMMPKMEQVGKIVKKLNLTEAQQKDFDKIKAEGMKAMIANVAKMATAKVDLDQLMKADAPDQKTIEKKVDELGDMMSSTGKTLLGTWFAVNKILTSEQQMVWKKALNAGQMMQGKMKKSQGRETMRWEGREPIIERRLEIRKEGDKEEVEKK